MFLLHGLRFRVYIHSSKNIHSQSTKKQRPANAVPIMLNLLTHDERDPKDTNGLSRVCSAANSTCIAFNIVEAMATANRIGPYRRAK